jgi:hypothetical protein
MGDTDRRLESGWQGRFYEEFTVGVFPGGGYVPTL